MVYVKYSKCALGCAFNLKVKYSEYLYIEIFTTMVPYRRGVVAYYHLFVNPCQVFLSPLFCKHVVQIILSTWKYFCQLEHKTDKIVKNNHFCPFYFYFCPKYISQPLIYIINLQALHAITNLKYNN